MAMTEVLMGNSKQYTGEFRAQAVKQVRAREFAAPGTPISRSWRRYW